MNRARSADQAARTCENFFNSIVKITRLYDYQAWQTHFWQLRLFQTEFNGMLVPVRTSVVLHWRNGRAQPVSKKG